MILAAPTLPVITVLKYLLRLVIDIIPLMLGLPDHLANLTVCTYSILVRLAGPSTFVRTPLIPAVCYQHFSCLNWFCDG